MAARDVGLMHFERPGCRLFLVGVDSPALFLKVMPPWDITGSQVFRDLLAGPGFMLGLKSETEQKKKAAKAVEVEKLWAERGLRLILNIP